MKHRLASIYERIDLLLTQINIFNQHYKGMKRVELKNREIFHFKIFILKIFNLRRPMTRFQNMWIKCLRTMKSRNHSLLVIDRFSKKGFQMRVLGLRQMELNMVD